MAGMSKRAAKGKKSNKKKKSKSGQPSRFGLSRKGELILAGIGAFIILVVAAFLLWLAVTEWILPKNPKEMAATAAYGAEESADWKEFSASALIVGAKPKNENVYVNAKMWGALNLGKREDFAEAAAFHYKLSRCFIYDAATGRELGWYTKSGGYNDSKPSKPRGSPGK